MESFKNKLGAAYWRFVRKRCILGELKLSVKDDQQVSGYRKSKIETNCFGRI